MYQVSIFNNNIETIIHYPSADIETPHIINMPFKESLSTAEELSFLIPFNNPGYNLVNPLKSRVKVIDTRDNSIVFSGRVIPLKSSMESTGEFIKEVTCEGAMNYLNDTNTRRWHFQNQTPMQILTYLLAQHNGKVDITKQITLGVIELTQPITIDTNYETSLNAIISKLRNILGGDIRVQERNNLLYLDYLKAQGTNNYVEIKLGYNLKDMVIEYDPMDIVTRVIPLGYGEGINQLGIGSVNSNLEYIEDSVAIAEYGVIEGVPTNLDIQNADTLKIYGQTILNEKKQIKLVYSITQLDLSVLAGHEFETYDLGDTLHTLCDVMGVDVYARVVERERDLIVSPWDPTLTISTRPITLSDQIIDLKQRNLTLENAPQGNTCIFPLNSAENTDATHPVTFDLDIPKETVNINRVYINLHGRKYRANSKDAAAGGGSTTTSASGGGSTVTSSGGGGSTSTSASGGGGTSSNNGDHDHDLFHVNAGVELPATSATLYSYWINGASALWETNSVYLPGNGNMDPTDVIKTFGSNGSHSHTVSAHQHSVTILDHVHNIIIAAHTHAITILDHIHASVYGIFESTYPLNTKIKVNGVDIGVSFGDGVAAFDQYNIDITSKVNIGNNKIEISTEQNGRIEAIIYSQIFIQSK